MNREQTLASFQVYVTSVENGTWSGYVTADGTIYHFKSELQLLLWLTEQFPILNPEHDI